MAYSYVNYTGNGTQANWTFPFPYLDAKNVFVTVNGARAYFQFVNGNTVQIIPAPFDGTAIRIYRDTVTEATPNQWTDGSVLRDKDLNRLALFCLYAAQEQIDRNGTGGSDGGGSGPELTVEEILREITGLITVDAFGADLVARLDKIDANTLAIAQEVVNRGTAIDTVTTVQKGITDALSQRIDTVAATAGGVSSAAFVAEQTARADGDKASVDAINLLRSQTADNITAAVAQEAAARTSAGYAFANTVDTIQASLTGPNGITSQLATVKQEAEASATALGVVNANYTLKTQALSGGKLAVAGIGLNASATGTTTQSEIIFAADKFQFISTIGSTLETPKTLLQVGVVNGVNTLILAPTVLGDKTVGARMIVDGSITAAQMATGTITAQSGLIADLAVSTLKIQDNAITIPVAVRNPNTTTVNAASTVLVSASIVSTGAPITISGGVTLGCAMNANQNLTSFTLELYRGSTLLSSQVVAFGPNPLVGGTSTAKSFYESPGIVPYVDRPGAGSWTYTLQIAGTGLTAQPGAALVLMEVKK